MKNSYDPYATVILSESKFSFCFIEFITKGEIEILFNASSLVKEYTRASFEIHFAVEIENGQSIISSIIPTTSNWPIDDILESFFLYPLTEFLNSSLDEIVLDMSDFMSLNNSSMTK